MANDLKVFVVTMSHYHSDDGAHDPDRDVNKHVVIASTIAIARAAIRPSYGSAWEMTTKQHPLTDGKVVL